MTIEQGRYQVRFDWGVAGAAAIGGDADLIIWVDALGVRPLELARVPAGCAVVAVALPDSSAVAGYVVDLQHRLGRRAMVAVVAAGDEGNERMRFAVEDLLAAGAVVDALGELGIDATSPEAAAAEAAYSGLRGAVGHLMTASVTAANGTVVPSGSGRVDDRRVAADLRVLRPHPADRPTQRR